ncbi:polysaccharide deacetylase family protein [uncultured Piscinibacter sp.]|uniref:polysaccharide deacetylase family protein n=1 Tax=uncultured Piscinibacter sp. TaxID=1131835 RepID=UPI00263049FD|nr:polysaccharide deacetylase family protein [uncultured Piscinibacter sp.]
MYKLPLLLASPSGNAARLSILIFHRVLRSRDALFPEVPDAQSFAEQMSWVKRWFRVMPLEAAAEALFRGNLESRAIAITFDDGYADNLEVAAPILRSLGLPATVFVSTAYLDGAVMWNDRVIEALRACRLPELRLDAAGLGRHALASDSDRRAAIDQLLERIKHRTSQERTHAVDVIVEAAGVDPPAPLMMNRQQLRSLRDCGIAIGAHTVSHPILTKIPGAEALREMRESKLTLEEILGQPVRAFAYPNGVPGQDYGAEHVQMAKECGFGCAVSTAWGAASMRSDRFQLPRFTPWDRGQLRFGARLLANLRRQEERVA